MRDPMIRRSLSLLVPSFLILTLGGCGRPPQIGADKESFRTVDALYTAVGLREPKLIEQCRARLDGLREAGKLPASASRSLESIIDDAREGKWEIAQDRLAKFMEGQRR
jgi:hypothetical protein